MFQLSYGDGEVARLEKMRIEIREKIRRLWRTAGLALAAVVGLTVYLAYLSQDDPSYESAWMWGLGFTIVGVLAVLGFWISLSHKFTERFNLKALPLIVNDVWPDAEWVPEGLMDIECLVDGEILHSEKKADRYDGKDLFKGTWSGLPIEMSYVKAEERRRRQRKGKTEIYYATLYAGIVLKAERFGHPGFTKISYREPGWDLNLKLPGWFTGMSPRPEIQLETNDPVLGKRFTLMSDEPEAGRALITEELLVTLHKLKSAGNGVPTVVLTPLSLYVFLRGEDFGLKPSLKKPIHQQATVGKQYEEFQHLLRIVELLAQEPPS